MKEANGEETVPAGRRVPCCRAPLCPAPWPDSRRAVGYANTWGPPSQDGGPHVFGASGGEFAVPHGGDKH